MIEDKNCIIYLIRASDKDVDEFIKSIHSLENYFLNNNPCDILCYHEIDLQPYINKIKKEIKTKLNFFEIEFSLPDFYKNFNIPEFFPHPTHGNGPLAWGHPGFGMGYRHMCRFFCGEFYKMPQLDDYKYYMRMDTDSFILGPVNYNVFKYMETNNKNYGYIPTAIQRDNPKVIEDLWNMSLVWYEKNSNICIRSPEDITEGLMYYTNFEIGNINWFKNSMYKDYYSFLDQSGGIFTKRWGDAPMRFLALSMLMSDEQKYPICNIPYQHGACYNI
tara:strand:- start:580 stop:1404 length:825 start_codon:yes stop_codon:yes gene_type:complete